MLREDIQDQRRAIEHARVKKFFQVALLRGREFIVKDHQSKPGGFLQIRKLLCPPFANIGRDIGMA